MNANDNPQPPLAKRSGSQKRVRERKIPVACDEAEFLLIDDRARAVGLSRPSFLRACGLGTPGPRAKRSPPVNAEALARATAALNKVGSNLNQIGRVLNAGGTSVTSRECFAALAEARAAAAAIREIVGRRDRP
jgi:Bacterial mobilisation protein (MobC)